MGTIRVPAAGLLAALRPGQLWQRSSTTLMATANDQTAGSRKSPRTYSRRATSSVVGHATGTRMSVEAQLVTATLHVASRPGKPTRTEGRAASEDAEAARQPFA